MSTPTGNLYLQVYNKAAGKFIEIPENVGAINFSARTGLQTTNFSRTPNFSGFTFSNSIDVKNLEMMPINIGTYNRTGNSIYAINLGVYNINEVTISGFNYSGFVCSNNFGYFNQGSNTTYAFNLGGSNYVNSSHQTYNVGANNLVNESLYSFNLGILNSIYTGDNTYVFGNSNTLVEGTNVLILGNENLNIKNINDTNINGSNNSITSGDSIYLIGNQNNLSGINNIINIGDQNNLNNSSFITLIGNQNNSTKDSSYQLILGDNNSSISSNANKTIGDSNSLTSGSSNNRIFGNLNFIGGTDNIINGDSNSAFFDVYQSNICGYSNSLSGTNNSYAMGSNNNLDPAIIDLLYRVDLTGITGSGPTLFTGVTGYVILGGYENIPGSGGNYNFIFGNNNKTSLNDYVYSFGDSNSILSNNNSYIIGKQNYAELSEGSYILGEGNSVSGFKNYVIGNSNTTRSGDYNSILIGISHEFTGNFKTASINIASVDSNIEVSPNEVKINSPSRMKFNNEHVTVASDLNNYLNSLNGLSNSGSFGSYIINDPNYINLADQIELQSFAYSGREDRYYGGFSGFNVSSANAYNFTGFFRKQPVLYYPGLHSIYGDYYYQSNNENFEILFSRDIEALTGNWIISPKNSLGLLFYNKSTNTGVFPSSNWITTGSITEEVSGYNPAPSFTYSSSFTGFSPNQKINSSTSYTSNYFNNFGSVAYPSNDDVAVLYGNHIDPKFNVTWLIIDKYSSGVYYIDNSIASTTTPQTGWIATGYMGYTGRNPQDLTNRINNTGIKISLGTRSGIISSYDPTYGNIYVPFFY